MEGRDLVLAFSMSCAAYCDAPADCSESETPFSGIPDQRFDKFDQPVGIEGLLNVHPVCLALMKNQGNLRQLPPGATTV